MSLEMTAESSIGYAQRSLFSRFFATMLLCFVVIMIGVGGVLFQQFDNEQKKLLMSIASEYQRILNAHDGKKLSEISRNNPEQLIELHIAMFKVNEDSSLGWISGSRFSVDNIELAEIDWQQRSWTALFSAPNYMSLLLNGESNFWLVLDLNSQLKLKYQQWYWIAMALASLCFIIAIVVWRLINATLLPLHKLASVVDKTNDWSLDSLEKLEVMPDDGKNTGLQVLHVSINKLLRRLLATIDSMENTVDAIAHDLRTPLARISLSAEKTLSNRSSNTNESAELHHALSDCAESAQQANHMLSTLMGIHDEASGKYSLETSVVNLNKFIKETASYYQELAEDRNIYICTKNLSPCLLTTDAGRLNQILVNLIDNALKYSEAGSKIRLSCGELNAKEVFLEVSDQGIGIEPKYHQLIFKRLYRVDSSRTSSGYGLGLAQVSTLCTTLNAKIELSSSLGQGSCFRLVLAKKIAR